VRRAYLLNGLTWYYACSSPRPLRSKKILEIISPMSRTFHGVTFTGKPLYFACLVQTDTEEPKPLNVFEAIKVIEQ
jgi:hypothetical protein